MVLEPAHQGLVPAEDLHAVDAQVEIVLASRRLGARARAPGHHQRPGNQRRRLAGPAGLHRERAEIDLVAGQHHLLAGRGAHGLGAHGHRGFEQRQLVPGVAQAARRLGLAQRGQRLADLAQLEGLALHAPGDPLHGAKQVGQHRHAIGRAVGAPHVLEDHRRPALGQEPGLDLGHLELGRDRRAHPHQPALGLEAGDEVAQAGVGQEKISPGSSAAG